MRILVTNDDGIHAPGLKKISRRSPRASDDVWVLRRSTISPACRMRVRSTIRCGLPPDRANGTTPLRARRPIRHYGRAACAVR